MSQNKKNNNSELFAAMNRIRKEQHLSLKEAYAEAKKQLDANASQQAETATDEANKLYEKFLAKAKKGNVKVKFTNRKGKTIATTVTLCKNNIPTSRNTVIQGRRKAFHDGDIQVYDIRHGVYRPMPKNGLIELVG